MKCGFCNKEIDLSENATLPIMRCYGRTICPVCYANINFETTKETEQQKTVSAAKDRRQDMK